MKRFLLTSILALLFLALTSLILASGTPHALGSGLLQGTPTPNHGQHHGGGQPTTVPAPNGRHGQNHDNNAQPDLHQPMQDMMSQMQGMMDMMQGMEMSPEMSQNMGQMGMMMQMMQMMMDMHDTQDMHQMMSGMMDMMQGMMDTMQGMEMSSEMSGHMTHMHEMMAQMHEMHMNHTPSATTPNQHDNHPGSAGGHMGPIDSTGVLPATQNIGGQPLEFRLDEGVKVFEISAQPVLWNIVGDVQMTAWAYNGTVPGPMIRVTEGDQVRIIFTNNLPEPTTIHWHGIQVPNAMDGVPGLTQDPIQPGETFVYEFAAKPAGTFMYHPHYNSDVQIGLGLYAPFIIDPAEPVTPAPSVDVSIMLSEARIENGQTFAAMPMSGMEANYFTFNGKSSPDTETIQAKQGDTVRIRLYNIGQLSHPIHLHGMAFKIVAIDGFAVPATQQLLMDTVSIAPGQRYDIEFVASEVGKWMLHCHISHHLTNGDNHAEGEGGMMTIIEVSE